MSEDDKIQTLLAYLEEKPKAAPIARLAMERYRTNALRIATGGGSQDERREEINRWRNQLIDELYELAAELPPTLRCALGEEVLPEEIHTVADQLAQRDPLSAVVAHERAEVYKAHLVEFVKLWGVVGIHGFVCANQDGVPALMTLIGKLKNLYAK